MSIIKGTNQIVAGFGGTKRSIGEVYFSQSSLATDNSGALPLFTGETIASANTIYPEFYNWVLAHTELQCTSEEYESALTTYGECAKYVIGSGSLRLPLIKNYIKAANTAEGIKNIEAGLPNHKHYTTSRGGESDTDTTILTAWSDGHNPSYSLQGTATKATVYKTSLATDDGDVYGKSSTVTPASTTLYPWVVAYAAAIPASTAQAAEFQQGLSGKVDLAAGVTNDNVDYVVESYHDDESNWYRVYKSGWCEQGGYVPPNSGTSGTITFLKPFIDNHYTVASNTGNAAANNFFNLSAGFKTVTSIPWYKSAAAIAGDWIACGQSTAPTDTAEVFSSTLNTSQTPVLLHLDGNNANSGTAGLSWVGNSFTFVSAGKFGQCAKLNGYYDFRGLNFSETDKYTVEYWSGASEDNAGTYFTWGTGSGPSVILSIAINHGKNEFIIKQGDNTIAYQSGLSSSVDKWHHTAFVYHGDSTFTFFIDGKKVDYTLSASGATSVYNCIFNGESGKSLYDEFVVHNYERYTKDFKLQTTPYTLA